MQTFQTEQNIRTLVDEQLKNLGWNLKHGESCNVYQEQPRTTEEKKKLNGKRPDYVLYASDANRGKPIAVIETKKPGESLDKALVQGDWYAEQLDAPIVFATDGIYFKTLHTKKHGPLLLNGEEVDELLREFEAIKFLDENEVNTISKEVIDSRKELIKIFEDSNNILRDEGLRAGIERFGEFSNILFLKLISELEDYKDEQGRSNETVLDGYLRWSQWKNKEGSELLSFVNDIVLPTIGKKYADEEIFTKLTIKNPSVLKRIIDKLDPLNLINIDSDIKGDSFEYFLKQSTATKNDLGEYFTPRHIVKVMVKLLNPKIGEKIYDPFCGTGGTLIETFKHISTTMARTESNWKQLRTNTLYGNEITTTARITKMNMILAGDGHSGIEQKNSLKNPVEDKYDIVITNMPYSQKTEYGALYDLPTTNGDSICIQHCIKAIDKASEGGRMALVVPEGFLFRKDLQKTREYLLDRCTVKSIISLPQGVFLPYTGVKTNILYCTDVKKKKKQDKFWYFDVKNDGYSLDSHRAKLEGETDLQKFLSYRNPEAQEAGDNLSAGFTQISMDDVKANDFVLVGSRYKKMLSHTSSEWGTVRVRDIANAVSGFAFNSKGFSKIEGKPLIRIRDLKKNSTETKYRGDYAQAYLVSNGDFLIGMDGDFSATIWRGGEALLNQRVCKLEGFKDANKKYVFYVMQRALKHIEDNTPVTTVKHISIRQILDIEIPLPPRIIQDEIANELDSYQNIVDSAQQIVQAHRSILTIKDGWETVELGSVCSYEGGTQPPKSTFKLAPQDGYIRLLQIRDYKSDKNAAYIPVKERHKVCDETDIMIGRYGPPVFQILRGKSGAYNVALIKTVPDESRLLKEWLYYFLISESVQTHIISLSERARQAGVSPKDLDKLRVPLPPIDEQRQLIAQLEHEQSLIDSAKEISTLFRQKVINKLDRIWGH